MKAPIGLRQVAVIALAVGFGALAACSVRSTSGGQQADLGLIREAMGRVHESYVEPVGDDKLVETALKGMLEGLDPHSDYMDEQEYRDLMVQTRGTFGGIGAELGRDHDQTTVIAPIDDTPAARAGIRTGDVIAKIDGQSADELSLREVVDRLRGPAGSQVRLSILRASQPPFDVTLTRAVIRVASVKSHLETGRVGYARISVFNEHTQAETIAAVDRLRQEAGGKLDGFVLDLRNDPGGLLDAAVDVAGDFLDGGTVVSTRGRDQNDDQVYDADHAGDRLKGVPMIVLINGGSASAAEIVAGALQDHHRATLLGTKSFGKGSVQTIIPMEGHGALRLTTARYYTPSGRSIQAEGIRPDYVVVPPKTQQRADGEALHEADLRGALRNTGPVGGERTAASSVSGRVTSEADEDAPIDPAVIGTANDYQLKAALQRLRAMAGPQSGNG